MEADPSFGALFVEMEAPDMFIEQENQNPNIEGRGAWVIKGKASTMEHLKVLFRQEGAGYAPCEDYLARLESNAQANQADRVSDAWRRKLCEWCYEVVDHFGFDREVVSIALSFLDRTVAIKAQDPSSPITRRRFQLLAVTSLYMAIKIHGENESPNGPRRKLRISAFVELSRGFFSVETIEACEREILNDLHWKVNPPTMLRFISNFVGLMPTKIEDLRAARRSNVDGALTDVARYLTELSVCVAELSFNYQPSIIAYAAMLCATEVVQQSMDVPPEAIATFIATLNESTGYSPSMGRVLQVKAMLQELCPSMFEGPNAMPRHFLVARDPVDVIEQDENPRGESPVSVAHTDDGSPRMRRKRSRERQ